MQIVLFSAVPLDLTFLYVCVPPAGLQMNYTTSRESGRTSKNKRLADLDNGLIDEAQGLVASNGDRAASHSKACFLSSHLSSRAVTG